VSKRIRPDSWQAARDLVKNRGFDRRELPVMLASGKLNHYYVDGKHAVDCGDSLVMVATAVVDLAKANGIEFDAVGGLTMGADPLAIGISIVAHKYWFSVRKARKGRDRNQWIEGTRFDDEKLRVLLVDDVVNTGGSLIEAYNRVEEEGGVVTGVIPMVDRSDATAKAKLFAHRGVPYIPLMDYNDLGIEPV
jgi:orotate phosphoribosyltransferase